MYCLWSQTLCKSKDIKMIVKIHKNNDGKVILAVCDKELLGKKFEEGKLQLDLSSKFYDGKEMQEETLLKLFKSAYIINLVGKRSINIAIKAGIIDRERVIKIKNVPHAQVVLV